MMPLDQDIAAPSRLEELRRGWRPLLASSVGIGLGLSPIPPFTSGIFATALHAEFGWTRGQILGALMIVPFVLVLLGPVVGRLADRVGARKVAIGSTIGLSAALLILSTTSSNILSFYFGWGCLAVFSLGTLPVTYARVINSWFDRARGIALGIALAATGLTGALVPFYLNWLIGSFGWRVGYLGFAALPVCIALPFLVAWLKEAPVARVEAVAKPALEGETVKAALRHYRFWVIAAASLALSVGTSGLIPNFFPMLVDRGFTPAAATSALAALAISVTLGRLASGVLLDRLWAPIVAIVLVVPAILALAVIATPGLNGTTVAAAVVTMGLVAGAEFDLVAYMTGRYFGQRHFSEIYAIQYSIFGLGAGFAPAGYGVLRDQAGSYTPGLLLSVLLFVAAIVMLLTLGRYPVRLAAPAR
jgi:MFS family permease